MIEVRVRKNEIKVSGHAMYAPHGQDIVCAGVSSLVRTLIRSIEDLTRDEIEYKVSPGWVGYTVWESIGESKNSGGFLFCRHLYDR